MKWIPSQGDKRSWRRVFIEGLVVLSTITYLLVTDGVSNTIKSLRLTPQYLAYHWYHSIRPPHDFTTDFFGLTYLGRSGNILDDLTLAFGAQEKPLLFFLRDVAQNLGKDPKVFLDIGANVGQHTLFMSQYATEVHAFEPYPPVLQRLRNNIRHNKLDNVHIHEVGLGDRNAILPFYHPRADDSGTGGFVQRSSEQDTNYGTLRIIQGDDWFPKHGIHQVDLIKCDIEGYEKPAMRGLHDTLQRHRPVIVMEITTGLEKSFSSQKDLLETLPANYQVVTFCEWDNLSGHYALCEPDVAYQQTGIYNVVAYPEELSSKIPGLKPAHVKATEIR